MECPPCLFYRDFTGDRRFMADVMPTPPRKREPSFESRGADMGDFEAAFPGYAATSRLDDLRATEYSYLDEGGHVYLDYTGAGLPARSQLRAPAARIRAGADRDPHAENPTASASTRLVEEARSAVLAFFNASPRDYAVIFTPNATGACRLVGEAYSWRHGKRLVLTADNHNSVNGVR